MNPFARVFICGHPTRILSMVGFDRWVCEQDQALESIANAYSKVYSSRLGPSDGFPVPAIACEIARITGGKLELLWEQPDDCDDAVY